MKTLVKMLQKAHAGELGAYHAFLGHSNATKDAVERNRLNRIVGDEWEHKQIINEMLYSLNARPSKWRDKLFICIGKTFGALCHVFGRRLSFLGALLLEKLGIDSYDKIIVEATRLEFNRLVPYLVAMHLKELEHEEYFKLCLKRNKG